MKEYVIPRGTQDVFGEEIKYWHYIEQQIRQITKEFNVHEIRTPEFEHTELFARENDSSDMVNKEMYTFLDNGNRSLTLKPEGTAGFVRAYNNHKLFATGEPLQKFYYLTPAFRYERPQKGRLRIHHQFGVEFVGVKDPSVDVECILLGLTLCQRLGIKNYKLTINSLGDRESRINYINALKAYLYPHLDKLCSDCQRRYIQNPLRILDCKIDNDLDVLKNVVKINDYLSADAKNYFNRVCNLLDGLGIKYEVNPYLVRGLDYYNDTVFEVVPCDADGSQSTIFGGGRYDSLVSQLGGPDEISAFGFGIGLERLILNLKNSGFVLNNESDVDVYAICLDDSCKLSLLKMILDLRNIGYKCDMDFNNRSLKSQFKSASRLGAKYILIMGSDELNNQSVNVKFVDSGVQETVKIVDLVSKIEENRR